MRLRLSRLQDDAGVVQLEPAEPRELIGHGAVCSQHDLATVSASLVTKRVSNDSPCCGACIKVRDITVARGAQQNGAAFGVRCLRGERKTKSIVSRGPLVGSGGDMVERGLRPIARARRLNPQSR